MNAARKYDISRKERYEEKPPSARGPWRGKSKPVLHEKKPVGIGRGGFDLWEKRGWRQKHRR